MLFKAPHFRAKNKSIFFILLSTLVFAHEAKACFHEKKDLLQLPKTEFSKEIKKYDYILLGQVKAVEGFGPLMGKLFPAAKSQLKDLEKKHYEYAVEIKPERFWRGTPFKKIFATFHYENGDCTFGFRPGLNYLIFANVRKETKAGPGNSKPKTPFLVVGINSPSGAIVESIPKNTEFTSLNGYWGIMEKDQANKLLDQLGDGQLPSRSGSNID